MADSLKLCFLCYKNYQVFVVNKNAEEVVLGRDFEVEKIIRLLNEMDIFEET